MTQILNRDFGTKIEDRLLGVKFFVDFLIEIRRDGKANVLWS